MMVVLILIGLNCCSLPRRKHLQVLKEGFTVLLFVTITIVFNGHEDDSDLSSSSLCYSSPSLRPILMGAKNAQKREKTIFFFPLLQKKGSLWRERREKRTRFFFLPREESEKRASSLSAREKNQG